MMDAEVQESSEYSRIARQFDVVAPEQYVTVSRHFAPGKFADDLRAEPAKMPQRGWLARSESARRERDLRSYTDAPAASSSWLVEPGSGALGPPALSVSLADHGDGRRREESLRSRSGAPRSSRGAARRLAPRTWPASLAATSARVPCTCVTDSRRRRPVGSSRPLSDVINADPKTAP